MTTAGFGLALALASIPLVGGASLRFMTRGHKDPHFLIPPSSNRSPQANNLLEVFSTKHPTVSFQKNREIQLVSSQARHPYEPIECKNTFALHGTPQSVYVLTDATTKRSSTSTVCNEVSQQLFQEFMTTCLKSEKTLSAKSKKEKLPFTLSFRHARVTITSPLSVLLFDGEQEAAPYPRYPAGSVREIENLPLEVQAELKKGFKVQSFMRDERRREYSVSLKHCPFQN